MNATKQTIVLVVFAILLACAAFYLANRVDASQSQDNCNEVFNYTKSSDFSDSRVNINFESNDNQIDVSAQPGYQVTEVALEVADDGHPGFHVYATGAVNNFNPNPGSDIQVAKVAVKKVCASPTPTTSPTVTPTASPTSSPTSEPTATPSATPTAAPTPTGEVQVFFAPIPDTVCHDTAPPAPKQVTVTDFKDNQMTVHWIQTGGSKATIVYQVPSGPEYSLIGTQNDGVQTINLLTNDRYYVKVQQLDGCAASPFTPEILVTSEVVAREQATLGSK